MAVIIRYDDEDLEEEYNFLTIIYKQCLFIQENKRNQETRGNQENQGIEIEKE